MQTIERKQTAFRLRPELIRQLRIEAKRESLSLNTYVESLLMQSVRHIPNKDTIDAIKEARSDKELETLDMANFKQYVASL